MKHPPKQVLKGLLILQNILVKLMYSFPLTYFPLVAGQYGLSLSTVGGILGIYPIGTILVTFSYEHINRRVSKKFFYFMNAVCMQLGLLFFGYAANFTDAGLFVLFSTIARFLQGYSASISIMVYEVIFSLYPDDVTYNQAIIELFSLATISCGPSLSIVMNTQLGGYKSMFYALCLVFLLINCITVLVIYLCGIHDLPILSGDYQRSIQSLEGASSYKIKHNRGVNATNLINFSVFLAYMFVISLYSNYLATELDFTTQEISQSFMAIGTGYILGSLMFTVLPPPTGHLKGVIASGQLLLLVSLFFCYQQKSLGQGRSKTAIYTANFCLGLSDQIGCIQIIPELLRQFNRQDPSPEKQAFYKQRASVFYNLGFFVAELVGPLVSGYLFDSFGYELGVQVYIMATVVLVVVPFLVVSDPPAQRPENFDDLDDLKALLPRDLSSTPTTSYSLALE